jgi:hypothetical protein
MAGGGPQVPTPSRCKSISFLAERSRESVARVIDFVAGSPAMGERKEKSRAPCAGSDFRWLLSNLFGEFDDANLLGEFDDAVYH